MNFSGGTTTLSQDAKGEGKENFFADEFSILLCGWRDAFYVGGNLLMGKSYDSLFCIINLRILCFILAFTLALGLLKIKSFFNVVHFSTFWLVKMINLMSIWSLCSECKLPNPNSKSFEW